jgi:hypothetical protein
MRLALVSVSEMDDRSKWHALNLVAVLVRKCGGKHRASSVWSGVDCVIEDRYISPLPGPELDPSAVQPVAS